MLASLLSPASANAHGIQGRADLPVPVELFYYAAGAVLIVSFVGLALGWSRPRWNTVSWRPVPRWFESIARSDWLAWSARLFVLVVFLLTVGAACFGSAQVNLNLAPTMVWVVWWTGLVPLALVFGAVIRALSPWGTLALLLRLDRGGVRSSWPPRLGMWPATIGLVAIAWLELCVPTASTPRTLGALAVGYTLVTLVAMRRYGMERWLERGELFSVYSGVLARLSIWETRTSREGVTRLGVRAPIVGATKVVPVAGKVLFVTTMIGSVGFDGLSRSDIWTRIDLRLTNTVADLVAFDRVTAGTIAATVGLLTTIAFSFVAFELACLGADRVAGISANLTVGRAADAFIHSLIPIGAAYAIAHYFSFFFFQSQDVLRLLSDPFGSGHDYLGTADRTIDYRTLSANLIWGVQVGSIVVGHVLALMLAHDRALQIAHGSKRAVHSQYPMLALMVVYTVGGLWSLKSGMSA